MIYGQTYPHSFHDLTDEIGIRTLIMRQYWQVASSSSYPSQDEIDAQKPNTPSVSGGVLLMGDQTVKERGRYATYWTFQGINGDGKGTTFRTRANSLDYGFEPGFAQVPIQVNQNFSQMMAQFQGQPGNDGTTVIWPPELTAQSSNGLSLNQSSPGLNPMYGIQTFFEMEGVYRYRYAALDLPANLQAGVGFIADDLPGKPPAKKDGRNWLKAPVAYQRKGLIFDITEFYWLSRRGGWPEPVYRKNYFNA